MKNKNMKKTWIVIGIILVLVLVTILVIVETKKRPKEIKIGAILPLTGDAALYGQNIKKGIDLATAEINQKGGIHGAKITVIYEDSKANPTEGVSAFNQLVDIYGVPVVIGDAVSSVTLAIAPIADRKKVVVLSPLSSAPAITQAGDFIFRNVPSDLFGGRVAAYFAARDQGWKSLAILYANNDFGVGLKEVFSKWVKSLGSKIVASEAYEQGNTDFRTQLIKIKQANPDAIFLVGYREAPQILIQAKELGVKSYLLGTGLLEDPKIIDLAKQASEGVFFTQLQYTPDSSEQDVKQYADNFKNRYGSKADIIAAYGYDAMKVLAFAMGKSDLSPEKIKEELYKVKDFKGVTGEISFDENGDVIQPMGVKIIKNGVFVWYKRSILIN